MRERMYWETCPAVKRKAGELSGAWAFTGTRVPLYALFEDLADGATIESSSNGSRASTGNRFGLCWNMKEGC